MGIRIKHRDPKSTDFSSDEIIININEGTLFYKTPTGLFKLQGDNLNTTTIEGGGGGSGLLQTVTDTTGQTGVDFTLDSSGDLSATISGLNTTSDVTFNHITSSGNISGSLVSTGSFGLTTSTTGSFDAMNKYKLLMPVSFDHGENANVETYIPLYSTTDSDDNSYYHNWLAPYDGRLLKVVIGFSDNAPGNVWIRFRKDNGGDYDLDESGDIVELEYKAGCAVQTVYDFPFANSTFSKGDLVSLTFQKAGNDDVHVNGTIVFELDMTT